MRRILAALGLATLFAASGEAGPEPTTSEPATKATWTLSAKIHAPDARIEQILAEIAEEDD